MAETAVLGAGAWGTALAVVLARAGKSVVLCTRRPSHLESLRAARENTAYLPGIKLPDSLDLTDRWAEAAGAARIVVMAVPSRFARGAFGPIAHAIAPGTTVVSVTKGIEESSLKTMTQMLAEVARSTKRFAVLSGPGFAAEIARDKPAALVAAASDEGLARNVQQFFAVRPLRVYRSSDALGVELAGAAKNVIAIAAGISDGLDLGSSARAALITRGLAELMRLAAATGARRETIAGLAGLGDLVLTCTGELSRNRAFGLKLGQGKDAREILVRADGGPVAEGVANARAVRMLAERSRVEMPIVSAVYRIVYEGAAVGAMVEELLSREAKAEF